MGYAMELEEGWRVEIRLSKKNPDKVHIRLFLWDSCVCAASWKSYVPHLIGDVVGILPPRFERRIIDACKALHSQQLKLN